MNFYLIEKLSHKEFCFKREEDNTVIEQQETNENYISKVKFPSYLYINEEEEEN